MIPETPRQTAQTDAVTSFKPEALLPPEWSTAISGYNSPVANRKPTTDISKQCAQAMSQTFSTG